MTPDWSRPVDVDRLADARSGHVFVYALADFPRLREQLMRSEGQAEGSVSFAREQSLPVATLQVSATLQLQCQRCTQVVAVPVQGEAQIALVDDLAAAAALPEEIEPHLTESGRVLLRDLVEEELLLAMPLIARHDDELCAEVALPAADELEQPAAEEPLAETTQRPFAGLGELLKRR